MNPYRSRFHLLPPWCKWSSSLYRTSLSSSIYNLRPSVSLPLLATLPNTAFQFCEDGSLHHPFSHIFKFLFTFLLPISMFEMFFFFLNSDSHPVIRPLFVIISSTISVSHNWFSEAFQLSWSSTSMLAQAQALSMAS